MKEYVEFVKWCENLGEEPTPALLKYYGECRDHGCLDHIVNIVDTTTTIELPHPDEWPF